MTLTKEDVISRLQTRLSHQEGRDVAIEQNGSWYKIDGGKSVRFSELEQMLATLTDTTPAPQATAPVTTTTTGSGKMPKDSWRKKLAAQPRNQLPRGF
ncbi:hypothetical protein [Shewanella sp. YIC-542]|uniref:hypothetical protein n=1 Tax=Shewanella mytili TaxID=3377111 RepID=UPI00398E3832